MSARIHGTLVLALCCGCTLVGSRKRLAQLMQHATTFGPPSRRASNNGTPARHFGASLSLVRGAK